MNFSKMNNDDFDKLTEEELIEILNRGNLSDEEFANLVKVLEAKGMSGSIMMVDDPDSQEAKASVEYIQYHKKLPKRYKDMDSTSSPYMSQDEIKKSGDVLFSKKASIKDKKKALIILAHTGDIEAYKILEKYELNPDSELKIWINLAIQECQSFLKKEIMGSPIISIGKVTKIGRNDPCPCGSGKKYKKCCLNKI